MGENGDEAALLLLRVNETKILGLNFKVKVNFFFSPPSVH